MLDTARTSELVGCLECMAGSMLRDAVHMIKACGSIDIEMKQVEHSCRCGGEGCCVDDLSLKKI